VPSIIVVVGYLASFGFLALVLKSLPVGIVYAIWAAIGIALVAVLGKIMFGDPVLPIAIAGIVPIMGGVALVSLLGATAQLTSGQEAKDHQPEERARRHDEAAEEGPIA
jgi:multidrug transporter EmrE-like cation transporter